MATLGENLLRFKRNQKYIVADTETEGLNLYLSKPWQLAYARYEGNKLVEAKEEYIGWKDISVSKQAAFLTGFNLADYKRKSRPAAEVLGEIDKYLYDPEYIVVGHNWLGYDCFVHTTWRRLCGKKPDYSYLNKCIDTNCLAKAIKKGIKKPDNVDSLTWQFQLLNFREKGLKTSLGEMCKYFGIPLDETKQHNAVYDIDINYQVFAKEIWEVEI